MQSISRMGAAANTAESSINRLASTQARVANSFDKSARSVSNAERANELYYKSAARIEKMQVAMMERHQARQGLIAAGQLPGHVTTPARQNAGMSLMNAWAGFQLLGSAQHGFSSFLNLADAEYMGRKKMGMVGFKGDLMDRAEDAVKAMSRKYGNLSRGEIYEMLHEGVAIHGTADESIKNIEQQAKLMSFMEAFEGGKHKGTAGSTFREVQAWIKSMEMKGVLNEKDPAKRQQMIDDYVQAGMAIKAAYPSSQLRLGDMLLMQKRAGTAWYNLSDEFRFGYAPAMAQERGGQIVGTALMSAFASIRGGKKLSHNELKAMGEFGLVDGKTGRWTDDFQKKWADNPYLAAQDLVERVAKKNGLDPHNEAQKKELEEKLTKSFSWLFPNRTASTQFLDLAFNSENFKKHAEYMALVRKEMAEIDRLAKEGKVFYAGTKIGAETSLGKQLGNLGAAIGKPIEPVYISRTNAMANAVNRVAEGVNGFFKAHPAAAKVFGSTAMNVAAGIGGLAALAGVGLLVGVAKAGFGALGIGGAVARVGIAGAAGGLPAMAGAAALMAAPMMLGTSASHVKKLGAEAAAASDRMIKGMSAAGKAAESAGFLSRLGRFGLWGGLAAGAGMLAYQNRDSLAGFGSGAMEFGRRAYLFRLFSEDTAEIINNMFKNLKLDVPKLDFSSVQKAIESIASVLASVGAKLWDHIAFQMGLRSFAEHYGANGENIPSWATPAERAKIMGRILADNHAAMFNDSDAGTPYNGPMWSRLARMNNASFVAQPGFGAEVQAWGALPSVPQSEAQKEVSIRSTVEVNPGTPLTGQVTVTIDPSKITAAMAAIAGEVRNAVTGATQGSSNANRGESSPVNLGAGN